MKKIKNIININTCIEGYYWDSCKEVNLKISNGIDSDTCTLFRVNVWWDGVYRWKTLEEMYADFYAAAYSHEEVQEFINQEFIKEHLNYLPTYMLR